MSRTHRAETQNHLSGDLEAGEARFGRVWARLLMPLLSLAPVLGLVFGGVLGVAGFAPNAKADVDFYVAPQFGISSIISEIDGVVPGALVPLTFSGEDDDASPLLGGAIGLEMPMDEMLPREWLADIRLPNWPVRFEIEASGLREYDLVTKRFSDRFFSEITSTTTFANAWVDIPMMTMWRPFQYVFGLGRQPRLRSWLEPASFYLGSGVGFTAMEFKGTDNVFETDEEVLDFAWNVGAGFGYDVTERVALSAGYRYLGLGVDTGSQEVDILNASNKQKTGQTLEYDYQVHEFRVGIKIKLFSFRGAWR